MVRLFRSIFSLLLVGAIQGCSGTFKSSQNQVAGYTNSASQAFGTSAPMTSPTPTPAPAPAAAPPPSSTANVACPLSPRNLNQTSGVYSCSCTAKSTGNVWGTGIYTDDSNLCRAAVHAGAITSSGGLVTYAMAGPQSSYVGSTANGVATLSYSYWGSSFTFSSLGTTPPHTSSPTPSSTPSPTSTPSPSATPVTTAAGSSCNIRDYGAVGNGVTDDTAAINAANIACKGHIYIPGSTNCYLFNGTLTYNANINILNDSFAIIGDGPNLSCIMNTSPTSPTIVASAAEGGYINGVKFVHAMPASGGDGIRFSGVNNYTLIENAEFSNNDIGMNLTSTYYATIMNVTANNNLRNGIAMVMSGTPGEPIQWQLFNVTTSNNGSDGMYVTGEGAMGENNGFQAINNGGHGLNISSTVGLPGAVRIKNSLFQGNHGWGAYIDAAGADIVSSKFNNQQGGGIYATNRNDNVSMSDITVNNNGYHGVMTYGKSWQVNGGTVIGNTGSGFYAGAGYGRIANLSANNNTNYGVFIDSNVGGAVLMNLNSATNYPASDNINTVFVGAASIPILNAPIAQIPHPAPALPSFAGLCNVRTYGAVGDGATDDTAAIQNANTSCAGKIFFPASAGCYILNGSINVTGSYKIVGEQQWQSCIQSKSPGNPIILANNSASGLISGLHLTHSPPLFAAPAGHSTSGGDAIRITGTRPSANVTIQDIYAENNYIGLNLESATNSRIQNVVVVNSVSHGVSMVGAPLDWKTDDLLSEVNGQAGLYINGSGTLADITSYQTYGNIGNGVEIHGAINAKFRNCFVGEDLQYGFWLDTAGGTIDISTCQLEGEGAGGLFATSNNAQINLHAIAADNNEGHALNLLASHWQVSGGNFAGNKGSAIVGSAGSGIVFNIRAVRNRGCAVYMDSSASGMVVGVDSHQNMTCDTFPASSSDKVFITGVVPN